MTTTTTASTSSDDTTFDESLGVPVIDLSPLVEAEDDSDASSSIIEAIANACRTYGFFQIVNHGIDESLQASFRVAMHQYFTQLDDDVKNAHRRSENNARGYFDDEYTKQKLDWKRALDVGMPGSRDWNVPDDDLINQNCLDGCNRIPNEQELPVFRNTIVQWFEACSQLSHRIATIMAAGILQIHDLKQAEQAEIVQDLKRHHTSYLRMNYYPVCEQIVKDKEDRYDDVAPLGISPHKDAGFLTVLIQDEDCHSLQVWSERYQCWYTVHPVRGALTINTGDMAQIWSNGFYKAPLHRVLAHPTSTRFSAPFFYNPGYQTWIKPVVVHQKMNNKPIHPEEASEEENKDDDDGRIYHPCLWGYFRAVRFAGDLVDDLGVEIQIEDFLKKPTTNAKNTTTTNRHVIKQAKFEQTVRFDEPFSVQRFRDFLKEEK